MSAQRKNKKLVRVREQSLPFALLPTTVDSTPNTDRLITHYSELEQWTKWFGSVRESDVIALDIETRRTNPTDPESAIVGIGFSHGRSSLYVDVSGIGGGHLEQLVNEIYLLPQS